MKAIGFTGSRHRLAEPQRIALQKVLQRLQTHGFTDLHHGDCLGADAAAHALAGLLGLRRTIHPPDNPAQRANCTAEASLPPAPYLTRNRVIVDSCEVLVACPEGPETVRSGTWSTVRYAKKMTRRVIVVWPDGRVSAP